jgi:hypothetical protein
LVPVANTCGPAQVNPWLRATSSATGSQFELSERQAR